MNQLLTEMDGINATKQIFVVGATNRPDIIDPDVDLAHMAEQTNGYSGADLGGICKNAAKIAIRNQIEAQVAKVKAKAAAREQALAEGIEYMSDDDEDEEDDVPTITMSMMLLALQDSTRSVTEADYKKYLDMKDLFESQNGAGIGGARPQPIPQGPAAANNPVNQPLDLNGDDD